MVSRAAEQREYRARVKRGERVARLTIERDRARDALIKIGAIPDSLSDNTDAEDRALEQILRRVFRNIESKGERDV